MEAFPDLILEAITSGKDLKEFKNKLIEAQTAAEPKQKVKEHIADKKDGVLVMVFFDSYLGPFINYVMQIWPFFEPLPPPPPGPLHDISWQKHQPPSQIT